MTDTVTKLCPLCSNLSQQPSGKKLSPRQIIQNDINTVKHGKKVMSQAFVQTYKSHKNCHQDK